MRRSRHRPPELKLKSNFVYVDVERFIGSGIDPDTGLDAGGSWVAQYQNMPCRFASTRILGAGALAQTEAGELSVSEYLMIFEGKYAVRARDRIKDYNGVYYRVNDVRPYATHKEAYCDTTEVD